MSLPWAVIQHVEWEGPGLIEGALRARQLEYSVHRSGPGLQDGAPLPRLGQFAGLIVMGGPMGVYEAGQYPFLAQEQMLLAQAAAEGLPVLGVCLGAQLLAAALGARVAPGPVPEVGEGTVTLTAEGRRDPVLGCGGHDQLPVVHWHQDTFSLPDSAVRLAGSDLYPQQAFRAGHRAYGLQFHCEVDAELAAAWRPRLPPGAELSPLHIEQVSATGRALLGRFFDLCGG